MSTDHLFEPPTLPKSPFTRAQALESGLSPWGLRQLVTAGVLRRPLREVYVEATLDDTVELRARSAALVVTEGAVLTDRSAAWLWGVDAMRPADLDVQPPLELFVVRGVTRVRRREIAGGVRDLASVDVTSIEGVRVTTPLRTSLDLGSRLSRYEALAVMDAFAREHHVTAGILAGQLYRFRRRRGVVQLRELVALVDPRLESHGESFTRLAIHDAGLPMPRPQYWVRVDGATSYRLDFAYPRLKICVEYDGQEFHTSVRDRSADEDRRKWLRRHGWIVIVVTKDSFASDARDTWTRELCRAIEQRSAR